MYNIIMVFFILLAQTPGSNRSSLSNQFMKQKKQKLVTIGNSSLFTEQTLSPLVTNSKLHWVRIIMYDIAQLFDGKY